MKRWILPSLFILFAVIFLVSAWLMTDYWIDAKKQQKEFDTLAGIMEKSAAATVTDIVKTEDEPEVPAFVALTDPETGEEIQVLPEFAELYTMNHHIVGWISIDGTNINYPVMQTPNSTDYYLYRGFDREYSRHGCIYVREECDVFTPSDNITIYGHRMGDGTMFNDLHRYADKDFYEDHRYITFNTLTDHHSYEILYVFRISSTVDHPFQFQNFTNAKTEEEFDEFLENCDAYSLYDTGVTAAYGDKLITLATCEYTRTNGRLVVVAKGIE